MVTRYSYLLKTNSSNSRLFLQDLYTYPTLPYLVYVLTVHTSLVNAIFRNQEYEKSKNQKVETRTSPCEKVCK